MKVSDNKIRIHCLITFLMIVCCLIGLYLIIRPIPTDMKDFSLDSDVVSTTGIVQVTTLQRKTSTVTLSSINTETHTTSIISNNSYPGTSLINTSDLVEAPPILTHTESKQFLESPLENTPEVGAETDVEVFGTEDFLEDFMVTSAEYFVYKPGTHYVHLSTCKWVDDSCYFITDTEGLIARRCSDCCPNISIINEYVEEDSSSENDNMEFIKTFSRGTYYCYGTSKCGGSGRQLIDCSTGDGNVKGSIASSYLYSTYGYNYNGNRTKVYLEINNHPDMNGYYYLDDSDAGNSNVIDFFYINGSNCQFQQEGIVSVDCYIVT